MTGRISYGAPVDFAPSSIAGGTAELGDIFGAAFDAETDDNINGATQRLDDAYATRSRAIEAVTGVDLGNPLVLPGTAGASRGGTEYMVPQQRAAYAARLAELAKQFPQHADVIKPDVPLEQDAEAAARAAGDRLDRLMTSNPSWGAAVTSFLGSSVGSFRDPLVVGSLILGGGPGAARTVVGRILAVAAKEALINGGVTAAQQPFVQAWRQEAGLPSGWDQAAQNVLAAAAVGGLFGAGTRGLHEGVAAVLGKARPALPADARGAIDATALDTATVAQKPQSVAPERFDASVAGADRAAQAIEPASSFAPGQPARDLAPTPVDIEAEVAQITDSLAPHPDSVSGLTDAPTAAELDRRAATLLKPAEAAQRVPTPILDHIRVLGGVDPGSPAAAELRAVGVTQRSVFKKGGLTALDNLPHDELPAAARFAIADDGNGYAEPDALIRAAGDEAQGGGGQAVSDFDAERQSLERRGVDFSGDPAQIRAKLGELADVDRRYRAANAEDGLSTDEVVSVPDGRTRREHTEQLVRQVLALQPGLPAERVREAVNLSLFERTPIEQAVRDMLSDAAGVPREEAAIGAAYDQVHANPTGPANEPLARIAPADIEGTILERGAFRDVNEVEFNRRGYGLVKVIWRHGEESALPEALRVHKADVMALPQLVRDFEPSAGGPADRGREWRVRREGRTLVYADTRFADGERHVVTIHVEDPAKGKGGPLSERRASQSVPPGVVTARGDTAAGISSADRGATERPGGSIDLSELPSQPPGLPPEDGLAPAQADRSTGELKADFTAERAALEELGYGGDVKLPIGDELVSLDELEARFKDQKFLESVVEACKA